MMLLSGCYVEEAPPPANGATAAQQQPPAAPPPMPVQPEGAPPPLMLPNPENGGGIYVVAATYGANLGLPRGNVTGHLARICNARQSCTYRVDVNVLGDPAPGRAKDFLAEWQCASQGGLYRAGAAPEAGEGSMVTLTCNTPAYPPPQYAPPPR
jgi:hypothetical protein